jgi:hypothetical protein
MQTRTTLDKVAKEKKAGRMRGRMKGRNEKRGHDKGLLYKQKNLIFIFKNSKTAAESTKTPIIALTVCEEP